MPGHFPASGFLVFPTPQSDSQRSLNTTSERSRRMGSVSQHIQIKRRNIRTRAWSVPNSQIGSDNSPCSNETSGPEGSKVSVAATWHGRHFRAEDAAFVQELLQQCLPFGFIEPCPQHVFNEKTFSFILICDRS